MTHKKNSKARCIFCNEYSSDALPVVASDHIIDSTLYGLCLHCSGLVNTAFADGQVNEPEITGSEEHAASLIKKLLKPAEIVDFLNKTIISQDNAKRDISAAIYEHMKRKVLVDVMGESPVRKSNVFMMGKSGVSKTEIMRQVAKLLQLPMITIDCTSLSEAGYVGDSIDDKMAELVSRADGDLSAAEFGIVYLDEVDKLRRMNSSSQTTASVGHQGVQESLLKIIEGSEITVPTGKLPKASGRATNRLNTANILFIASGAFTGIESLVSDKNANEIGFIKSKGNDKESDKCDESKIYRKIKTKHLIEYGFEPEFIGRFSNFIAFDDLTKDDLVQILKTSKLSKVKESIISMRLDGCELSFEDDSFSAIADLAIKEKTGARALSSIVDGVLKEARYSASNGDLSRLVVTADYVKLAMKS